MDGGMKKKIAVLLLAIVWALLAACQPGTFIVTITPPPVLTETATATVCEWPCTQQDKMTAQALRATGDISFTLTAQAPSETPTPACSNWPCPADSLTLTAAARQTMILPSNTPPVNMTIIPGAGDLGWGSVYGTVTDGWTGKPVANAKISCLHSSYTTPENARCYGTTWTNDSGIYAFVPVFFHDTDIITLLVDAPGYKQLEFRQVFFTTAALKADLVLEPVSVEDSISPSPTYTLMCTAPACSAGQGVLSCGTAGGCPGGCGTICATLTPGP